MKTFTLPGGIAGPPSAAASASNRVDVFAAGPGNTVWRWSLTGSTWSAPAPLALGPASIPATGVCAISSGPGRVEVFAGDKNGRGPVWWRGEAGKSWTPVIVMPASGAMLPAESVPAACATSPTNIDVFAAGRGNVPWWWHWDGLSWAQGLSLGGGGASLPGEPMAAVSPNPGVLDIFAVGIDHHLWHWHKDAVPWPGGWHPAEDLGGNLANLAVSAVSWGPGRVDVFGVSAAAGNPVQHWASEGGAFVTDQLPMPPRDIDDRGIVAGTVATTSHVPNRLDVVGVTGDQRIAHWQWDGGHWIGPNHHGAGIPAGNLTVVSRTWPTLAPRVPVRRRVDVFAAGVGNSLLQWPGGGLENVTTKHWMNWPTNLVKSNATVARPDSLEELVSVITSAEQNGQAVRAVGSSWSNSEAAVSPGYVIETDALANILTEITSDCLRPAAAGRKLVHVEGGIKLWQLNAILDSKNLALHTMGGSSGQSVAGVLSTSAHGMDIDRGPIPDMVRAIHLVGPGGVQHWIEPRDDPITDHDAVAAVLNLPSENVHYDDDWFNSALVGVGNLGVVYSLIIEVDDQYDLRSQVDMLDWESAKTALKGGAGDPFPGNRAVQVVINPYIGTSTRSCYLTTRKTLSPTGPAPKGMPTWLTAALSSLIVSGLQANRPTIPATVVMLTHQNQIDDLHKTTRSLQGISHTIMGGPDPGGARGLTVEMIFDATPPKAAYLDFVDAALKIISDQFDGPANLGYLGWVSLRFQGRSRAYLSPQHSQEEGHRTATAEFAAFWRIPEINMKWNDTPTLIDDIEAKGREFGGVAHWGLSNLINATDVIGAYPRLDSWRRVRWHLTKSGTIHTFDSPFARRCGLTDPPFPALAGDYDGDGKDDLAVYRPSDGSWWFIDNSGATRTLSFGGPGDHPVPGDYDGDGKTDVMVWNAYKATWRKMGGRRTKPIPWGRVGDVPVPGDYTGDGRTDLAVWRPADGTWWVLDSSGGKNITQQWGQVGDIPVPGDYDGDGTTDFAVWRPAEGNWHVINSSTKTPRAPQQWGQAGDIPVPGDYDGDAKTDFAVWRPSDGNWYVIDSSTGNGRAVHWGQAGDIPVPGRYTSPNRTDYAVWRPSDGTWHILDSATLTERSQQWGVLGDIPV